MFKKNHNGLCGYGFAPNTSAMSHPKVPKWHDTVPYQGFMRFVQVLAVDEGRIGRGRGWGILMEQLDSLDPSFLTNHQTNFFPFPPHCTPETTIAMMEIIFLKPFCFYVGVGMDCNAILVLFTFNQRLLLLSNSTTTRPQRNASIDRKCRNWRNKLILLWTIIWFCDVTLGT